MCHRPTYTPHWNTNLDQYGRLCPECPQQDAPKLFPALPPPLLHRVMSLFTPEAAMDKAPPPGVSKDLAATTPDHQPETEYGFEHLEAGLDLIHQQRVHLTQFHIAEPNTQWLRKEKLPLHPFYPGAHLAAITRAGEDKEQRERMVNRAKRECGRWYRAQMLGADRKVSAILALIGTHRREFDRPEMRLCRLLQGMAIMFRTFKEKEKDYELMRRYIFLKFLPCQVTKFDRALTERLRVAFTESGAANPYEIDKFAWYVEKLCARKANMPVGFRRIVLLVRIQRKLRTLNFILEKTSQVIEIAEPLLEVLGKSEPFWLPCKSLPPQLVRSMAETYPGLEVMEGARPKSCCKPREKRVTFADEHPGTQKPSNLKPSMFVFSAQKPTAQETLANQSFPQPSTSQLLPLKPSFQRRSILKRSVVQLASSKLKAHNPLSLIPTKLNPSTSQQVPPSTHLQSSCTAKAEKQSCTGNMATKSGWVRLPSGPDKLGKLAGSGAATTKKTKHTLMHKRKRSKDGHLSRDMGTNKPAACEITQVVKTESDEYWASFMRRKLGIRKSGR